MHPASASGSLNLQNPCMTLIGGSSNQNSLRYVRDTANLVQAKGVEPLILAATASKTVMYTSSNTPAYLVHIENHSAKCVFIYSEVSALLKDFDNRFLFTMVKRSPTAYGLYLRETT